MSNRKSYLFFLTILLSFDLGSQTCSGNLGENIFTDGDFGNGMANILFPDPKIAPGYLYGTQGPPQDGIYVICNSTNWPGLFGTWLRIKDNSNDPNGYMMVVNASFTPGLFYEKTITGLCENTLYEFKADLFNLISRTATNQILPNVTFLLDDVEKYNTGAIPQSEQWNTAGFTFTTRPGQFQLKLSLKNNAPGGIGNDLAIDNISFRACGPKALILPQTIANICEDGNPITLRATIEGSQFSKPAIQWQISENGVTNWQNLGKDTIQVHTKLKSGFYYYRYLLAGTEQNLVNNKCHLISNVKTVYVQPKFYSIYDTLCSGLSYPFGRSQINKSGIYIDTLKSALGCDSIVTLNLYIAPHSNIDIDEIVSLPSCAGAKDATITIPSVINGYPPFTILIDNKPLPNNQILRSLSSGTYGIKITDHFKCSFTKTIIISEPPKFSVDVGKDLVINLGDEIRLLTQSNQLINKSTFGYDKNVICSTSCEGSFFVPYTSGRLVVDATNNTGCKAFDTLSILVNENINLFVPNIFTPNEDGVNDLFLPLTTKHAVKEIVSFKVFNRFGGILHAVKNIPINDNLLAWDGKFHGKPMPQGTYVYLLDLKLINDKIVSKAGDVHILR